jgi:hypothetical protein
MDPAGSGFRLVIAQEKISRPFLTVDYPRHTGLHIDQAVYGEARPDGKNNIAGRRKQMTVETEDLPYQSFYSVAPHCITSFFLHTDSQPIVRLAVRKENNTKPIASKPLAKSINALKLPGGPKQMNLGKTKTAQLAQADNCFRPFALLLLITACPDRVFIRTRKPWVRARLILLGWNVLLLIIQFLSLV